MKIEKQMNIEKYTQFIERYLGGEMDSAEESWFRKKIEENEDLHTEIKLWEKVENVLKDQPVLNLRRKLNSIESSRGRKLSRSMKPGWKIILRYAAVGALMIIAGSIALFNEYRPDSSEIIKRFYSPYEVSTASRAGLAETSKDYDLAIESYNNCDYRNAAIYLDRVIRDEPGNMHCALLNGVARFETGDYEEAKKSLKLLISDDNNLYIDHARWYLSLCYLKEENFTSAAGLLAVIRDSQSIYRKRAGRILRMLRNRY